MGGSAVEDKGNKGDKGKMTGSLKTKAAGDPSTKPRARATSRNTGPKGRGTATTSRATARTAARRRGTPQPRRALKPPRTKVF